jgi:hypothetical protein
VKVTQTLKNKIWEGIDASDAMARSRFIEWVMKEEDCDYETAYALCTRHTDPVEPEYSLGYKMASPVYQVAMNAQVRRSKREQAIENFKQMLEPDELEIFERDVLTKDTRKMWKEEKKKQKVKE